MYLFNSIHFTVISVVDASIFSFQEVFSFQKTSPSLSGDAMDTLAHCSDDADVSWTAFSGLAQSGDTSIIIWLFKLFASMKT